MKRSQTLFLGICGNLSIFKMQIWKLHNMYVSTFMGNTPSMKGACFTWSTLCFLYIWPFFQNVLLLDIYIWGEEEKEEGGNWAIRKERNLPLADVIFYTTERPHGQKHNFGQFVNKNGCYCNFPPFFSQQNIYFIRFLIKKIESIS